MFFKYDHPSSPDFMELEVRENLSLHLHYHRSFEIIFVQTGELNVYIEGETTTLSPGMAVMIFPDQIHSFSSTQCKHLHCTFSPHLVPAFSSKYAKLTPESNLFNIDEYLLNALLNLTSQSTDIEKKGVLYLICHHFNQQITYKSTKPKKVSILHQMISFVSDHLTDDCTLKTVAAELGYDYSYLSRHFKKATGISFNAYVTQSRLLHAQALLNDTDLTISQCAMDSGFTTLRNFNLVFKKVCGITPDEYRKGAKCRPIKADQI